MIDIGSKRRMIAHVRVEASIGKVQYLKNYLLYSGRRSVIHYGC